MNNKNNNNNKIIIIIIYYYSFVHLIAIIINKFIRLIVKISYTIYKFEKKKKCN